MANGWGTSSEHLQRLKHTAGLELFPTSEDAILPCNAAHLRDSKLIVEVSLESEQRDTS